MKLYDKETNAEIALPTLLTSFRGDEWYVLDVDQPASGGSSGKVRACTPGDVDQRTFFPGVFGCYIADEPKGGES